MLLFCKFLVKSEDNNFCSFITARRYASAVYAVVMCLSVRLSVCPSVCHNSISQSINH